MVVIRLSGSPVTAEGGPFAGIRLSGTLIATEDGAPRHFADEVEAADFIDKIIRPEFVKLSPTERRLVRIAIDPE
jgi:hypothetical protein